MFIAHFGLALAAKKAAPEVSLGRLFVAAQLSDLMWPTLSLLGLEWARIDPTANASVPLVFEHYPISHSLVTVLLWALLFGTLHRLGGGRVRGALVLGALVLSHWMLDVIVHVPDLPLWPGSSTQLGFGLWNDVPRAQGVELSIALAGMAVYSRTTVALDSLGTWAWRALMASLLAIHAANSVGAPPPDLSALIWVGHAQWLLVVWAWLADRHRRALVDHATVT